MGDAPKQDAGVLASFDGGVWAREFCRIAAEQGHALDEGWVLCWFCNALMRGYDEHARRFPTLADAGAPELPLTREQIDWIQGTDDPNNPDHPKTLRLSLRTFVLFCNQARAALDLAEENARLRAEVERLREALGAILANEVYEYEGRLEAQITVSCDVVQQARDALAEPDRG